MLVVGRVKFMTARTSNALRKNCCCCRPAGRFATIVTRVAEIVEAVVSPPLLAATILVTCSWEKAQRGVGAVWKKAMRFRRWDL